MRILLSFMTVSILTMQALADAQPADHFPQIIDETALKESVSPCDDFYQFACGTWIDQTPIPPEKKGLNRQATPMGDSVDIRLNQILEAYSKGDFKVPATYATKLADLYTSCMNVDTQTAEALKIVRAQLQKVKRARSMDNVSALLAQYQLSGTGVFFGLYSMQDYNDSTHVLADIGQGGMALNNPAYYLEQDAKSVEIRQKYTEYIATLFQLNGTEVQASKDIATKILAIETALAQKALSVTDQSDPENVNHVMDLAALKKLTPHFNWDIYFQKLGTLPTSFNVDAPEFMSNFDSILSQLSKVDRDHYLTFILLNQASEKMGGDFEKANFSFWKTTMNGEQVMAPRWKVCTQAVENSMGYALAEAYVKTFDGNAIKEKTNSMIDTIKQTFVDDLNMLSTGVEAWIDGDTASQAISKAQAVGRMVGAPETFRDYSSLKTSASSYLLNSFRLSNFESHRDLNKIGKPVDKTEWGMMPWEVNAYYDRSNNEFVFPFGILQPPSLDLTASDGANYGSFGGGTIGHELTHGFDSQGSKYDSQGNLKNWWSPETQAKFDQKTQCYVDQANAYKIEQVGLNVNGAQTLEENLADQGGVKLGYMALSKILTTRPEAPKWLGKYSERQQYWIGYAQSWCSKYTSESLRSQMTNDVHPPAEFRVNAVVMNRPEFANDFSCSAGARMAPVNRCSLW